MLRASFRKVDVRYPPVEIYFRAFKADAKLELWANDRVGAPMRRVIIWPIAQQSGVLGPKRREGDLQVPEGLYFIDRFNPRSRFHLSLGINYPNASDQVRGTAPLGGDIFIHGARVSIGCLAMTDPLIEQIYTVAQTGRRPIRADFFPTRRIDPRKAPNPEVAKLWKELQTAELQFRRTRRPPRFRIAKDGRYVISER